MSFTIPELYEKIERMIEENKIADNIEFINGVAKIFESQYSSIIKDSFAKSQLHALEICKELLQSLKQEKNPENIKKAFFELRKQYLELQQHNPCYLFRHTEQFDPSIKVKKSPLGRELSIEGVKQARKIAAMIISEALMVPFPIEVRLYHSPYHRTFLVAELIRRDILVRSEMLNLAITVSIKNEPLIDGDLIKVSPTDPNWEHSENTVELSQAIVQWFNNQQSSSKSLPYVITVGVTHMPNLAAFYVKVLKKSVADSIRMKLGSYAKKYNGEFIDGTI